MNQELTTELENDEISENTGLTANDRCDICGAQAYIRVELAAGDLIFCSHHGNEKRAQLEPVSIAWHDETAKLLAR